MRDDNHGASASALRPEARRVGEDAHPSPDVSAPTLAKGTAPRPTKPAQLKRNLIGAAVIALVSLATYLAASWWTTGRFMVTTDDAYIGARAATISPKIAGYVVDVAVADNATVKAGDILARIDRGDYELAVRAARDVCDSQRATIARIVKQTDSQRSVVAQAQAQLLSAKAAAVKAELDYNRQVQLAARKINSASALDQAQAANEQAKATVTAAEATIASAVANVAVLEAQRAEAESVLKQNETALAKAERDLTFTEIRAPFDGVLGNRAMQAGDYVQPAQRLASLVPLQSVYIDANFKETQLARIQPGQRVKITLDADAEHAIEGRVESVAPASGSVFSLLPPDNATGNFTKVVQRVPVRIALPQAVTTKSFLRAGMSVVVSVDTKPGTPLVQPQPAGAALTSGVAKPQPVN
jgi:membrane fusion protein (multidrug efflux system)